MIGSTEICSGFCKGPINLNAGIGCCLGYYDKDKRWNPTPMKHNPLSREAAENLIKNGGGKHICFKNPYRYLEVQQ